MSAKINRRAETTFILEQKLKARRALARKQLIELVEHWKTRDGVSYRSLNDQLQQRGYYRSDKTIFHDIKYGKKSPAKELIRALALYWPTAGFDKFLVEFYGGENV